MVHSEFATNTQTVAFGLTAEGGGYYRTVWASSGKIETIVPPSADQPRLEGDSNEQAIWDEIEKIAPSDEMLVAYAKSRKTPPQ